MFDAVKRAVGYGSRGFRAIYLSPKDRRAFGSATEVNGIPIRDGEHSRLYNSSGVAFHV